MEEKSFLKFKKKTLIPEALRSLYGCALCVESAPCWGPAILPRGEALPRSPTPRPPESAASARSLDPTIYLMDF